MFLQRSHLHACCMDLHLRMCVCGFVHKIDERKYPNTNLMNENTNYNYSGAL